MKDYSNHFRDLVERQLGDDPRILVPRGGQDMMILATWRLSGDLFRPNKRSRMIRIVISQEALETMPAAAKTAAGLRRTLRRLVSAPAEQLRSQS